VNKNNFSWLLLALLIFLFLVPIADDLHAGMGSVVRVLSFSCLMLIGVWSLHGGGRAYYLGLFFGIAATVMGVLAANLHSRVFLFALFTFIFGFLLVAIAFTLKRVALSEEINANRIIGAVCVYLLLGVIWAVAYTVLHMFSPGSFQGFVPKGEEGWNSEWLYFSFVTMTTLGYGDISPVTATARALAYMQALFGQLYVAVLVAGLVGTHISARQRQKQNED
jgi:voltage-gated potassium channel Kch